MARESVGWQCLGTVCSGIYSKFSEAGSFPTTKKDYNLKKTRYKPFDRFRRFFFGEKPRWRVGLGSLAGASG
jgi:hypothetical protein